MLSLLFSFCSYSTLLSYRGSTLFSSCTVAGCLYFPSFVPVICFCEAHLRFCRAEMWNCADFVVGMRGNSHRKSFCLLFSSSYFPLEKNSSNHVGHAFRLFKSGSWFFFFPTHITSIYDSETRMSLSNTGWLSACFGSRSCYLHKDCPPCMGRRYHIRSRFAGHRQTLKKKKKKKTSCSLLFVHSSGIFKIYFHVIRTRISYFHISFFKVIGWPAKFVVATNQFVWCLSYLFILIVSEEKNSLRAGGWYW